MHDEVNTLRSASLLGMRQHGSSKIHEASGRGAEQGLSFLLVDLCLYSRREPQLFFLALVNHVFSRDTLDTRLNGPVCSVLRATRSTYLVISRPELPNTPRSQSPAPTSVIAAHMVHTLAVCKLLLQDTSSATSVIPVVNFA